MPKITLEALAATSAIVVSFAALFVAWDQSVVMRQQQHASVWPIVESDVSVLRDEQEQFISLTLNNVGVGPAILRDATITFNGEALINFDMLNDALLPVDLQNELQIEASSMSGVLGAGQERTSLRLVWKRNEQQDTAFMAMTRKFVGQSSVDIDIELCYCSVFEKCWKADDSATSMPVQVETCPSGREDPIEVLMATIE